MNYEALPPTYTTATNAGPGSRQHHLATTTASGTHTSPSLQTRAGGVPVFFPTTTHHFSLAANASRRGFGFSLLNYTHRPLPRCKREPEGFSVFFLRHVSPSLQTRAGEVFSFSLLNYYIPPPPS